MYISWPHNRIGRSAPICEPSQYNLPHVSFEPLACDTITFLKTLSMPLHSQPIWSVPIFGAIMLIFNTMDKLQTMEHKQNPSHCCGISQGYIHIPGGTGDFLGCYSRECSGEWWWEGSPRSHFHKPTASACHVTALLAWTLLTTSCFVSSAMDGKIKHQVLHQAR
jgi:hypothetical protein